MADLISVMTAIFTFLMEQFAQVFSTITSNPVLYLPVLVALFSSIVFFCVRLVRKFGVRGVSGGRRR